MSLTSTSLKELLASHIETERARVQPGMHQLREAAKGWYKTFEMDSNRLKSSIPFQGATAIFLPLLFEQTKLTYGKLWSILFRHRPLLQVLALDYNATKLFVEAASQTEHSLDNILHSEIRVREKLMPVLLDGIICGTSFAHIPFRKDLKMIPMRLPGVDEDDLDLIPTVTYAGADIEHIPLMHMTWPPEAPSIEKARWMEVDKFYSADELLELVELDLLAEKDAVWDIIQGGSDQPSEWDQLSMELMKAGTYHTPQFHLKDWWGWFRDPEKKELPRLYNVIQHPASKKILNVRYNPYDDQSYPFVNWSFFPRPGKILGIGAGRLLTSPNEALNEIWNQRINAGRIANSKMFKIRRGAGIKPSEKLYPGKRIYLTNPATDIMEMSFGDVKQSSYADSQDIVSWADRVMSTGGYARGEEQISRPNASGQMSLIGITNENISIIGDGLRIFLGRLGRLVYSRYRQFASAEKLLPSFSPETAALFLPAMSPDRLVFDLAAADERINEEADRQKLTAAYQMYTGYYEALIKYAELIDSPDAPPTMKMTAMKASMALTEFMKRIGRNLNLQGFETFLVEGVGNGSQPTPGVPALSPGTPQQVQPGEEGIFREGSPPGERVGGV